jgi:transketolase
MRLKALQMVYELAKQDPRIVFVGSDLGPGVLSEFKEQMPDRFFMEGIAEQHVIGMAAGLAKEGYIPYVNTIATFLTRRCYEQIAIDLCLHNLPVRLIGNGGGYVYAPLGPTHLAVEDIAIMRALPNMTVIAASDAHQMEQLMLQTPDINGPAYIRLAKGYDPIVTNLGDQFRIGHSHIMTDIGDVLIIATGVMLQRALAVQERLKLSAVSVGVLNIHTIKPLDEKAIFEHIKSAKLVVTMEEHSRIGGLGSAIVELMSDLYEEHLPRVVRFALPDQFCHDYGTQNQLLDGCGLSVDTMADHIQSVCQGAEAITC